MWVELSILSSIIIFLGKDEFKIERASQYILFGIALQLSKKTAFYLVRLPILCLVIYAIGSEIAYFMYKRRNKTAIQTWNHIQKLRAQRDFHLSHSYIFSGSK